MARPGGMFNKREKEKKRQKEKQEKRERMEERKATQTKGKSLEEMMAYIDENGNITSSPPDPQKKKVINVEDIEIGVPRPRDVEQPVQEGSIDYFDTSKGFGFIIQKDGQRIFFHVSQTTDTLSKGDLVNYTVEKGPKGWNAIDITKKA